MSFRQFTKLSKTAICEKLKILCYKVHVVIRTVIIRTINGGTTIYCIECLSHSKSILTHTPKFGYNFHGCKKHTATCVHYVHSGQVTCTVWAQRVMNTRVTRSSTRHTFDLHLSYNFHYYCTHVYFHVYTSTGEEQAYM